MTRYNISVRKAHKIADKREVEVALHRPEEFLIIGNNDKSICLHLKLSGFSVVGVGKSAYLLPGKYEGFTLILTNQEVEFSLMFSTVAAATFYLIVENSETIIRIRAET